MLEFLVSVIWLPVCDTWIIIIINIILGFLILSPVLKVNNEIDGSNLLIL